MYLQLKPAVATNELQYNVITHKLKGKTRDGIEREAQKLEIHKIHRNI